MNATLPGTSLKDFSRLLSCLAKIGDDVALEVRPGKLLLSTLNASRSAFLLVTLDATRFERFEYIPVASAGRGQSGSTAGGGGGGGAHNDHNLRCKLQLRALLSIFRPRNIESKDSRESAVEKCELKLLYPSSSTTAAHNGSSTTTTRNSTSECQLLVRLVCKHGVRKTYKLQYEETQTMHAVTDRTVCHNRFTIPARPLKDVMDHFAPRAEELTLAVNDGNLLLTSFTEGVMSDREVLKQPIHTSITIDYREFDVMTVDEELLITFGLREFKAVGILCDLLGTNVSVCYGGAGKPLLLDFDKDGMMGEFVVATTADGERTRTRDHGGTSAAVKIKPQSRHDVHESRTNGDPTPAAPSTQYDPLQDLPQPEDMPTQRSAQRSTQASQLFARDPDLDDSTVQARAAQFQKERRSDGNGNDDTAGYTGRPEESDDEEMRLYADDDAFGADQDMELGPTQTQTTHKARGLFD